MPRLRTATVSTTGTPKTRPLFSPRLGLIFKPTEELSLYGSYSRSYLPQSGDQFSSLDADRASLKPERFDNYEIGAKANLLNNRLQLTAALFRKLARQTGEGRLHYSAEFLQSHPLSMERAKKFDASFNVHTKYRSALSMDQSGALSNVCHSQED